LCTQCTPVINASENYNKTVFKNKSISTDIALYVDTRYRIFLN